MPAANLTIPGFYGKLPTAGDFVARRLPFDFVQRWDRWLAQHLAPLLSGDGWNEAAPLRFISGRAAFGPAAGIILSSRDRVGRRFPLSIVALLDEAPIAYAKAEEWFASVEALGRAAHRGELEPDELDEALSDLELAQPAGDEEVVEALVVWTRTSNLYDVEPQDPTEILEKLFADILEVN